MECGTGYFLEVISDIGKKDRAVIVDVKNLEARLLSCVPAYAGSQYSYCDKAEISGLFSSGYVGGLNFSILDVDSFSIYKYGEAIPVDLD